MTIFTRMFRTGCCLILVILWSLSLYPQSTQHDDLRKKISDNQVLFQDDPAQAFRQIDGLLKEAIELKDTEAELLILSKHYEYNYFLKIDFEQMLASANELKKQAKKHKNLLYEAKAHKYLAQAYSFNELYKKSLEELTLAMAILDKAPNKQDATITMEKANIHTAFANIYNLKKEFFSGIQSLLNSVKEHDKLKNEEWRRGSKFMDYANLGSAYLTINLDSAKFYAEKSISYSTEREANHNLTFLNYIVIGDVFFTKEDYTQALEYYKKAEAIQENKHFINVERLYKNLINIYEIQGEQKLKEDYETKLKDLSLTVSQNQNKSLRKIILDNKIENYYPKQNYTWIWVSGVLLLIGIATFVIYQNKKTVTKETHLTPETYNNLIKLLKENDQTFLLAFEKEFPDFTQKLSKSSIDGLSTSEIELLAMIKLGLSNKEIAQYKFIQHKTVQNRRHKIRKKLNLSNATDLDKWVEGL